MFLTVETKNRMEVARALMRFGRNLEAVNTELEQLHRKEMDLLALTTKLIDDYRELVVLEKHLGIIDLTEKKETDDH